MSPADIVIIVLLAVIVVAIVFFLARTRKKGGCAGCPYCNRCTQKSCQNSKKEE